MAMTLQDYYKSWFPADTVVSMFKTLAPLNHMEIALRGTSSTGNDFFRRYNAAADAKAMRELVAQPHIREIHLGGFYTQPVSREHCSKTPPRAKPLVFDIDLQDYRPIQEVIWNGVAKDNLTKCDLFLPLVLIGLEALKVALGDAFGFRSFACFYSGRRGAHLIVLDKAAFDLTEDARSAIASSLTVNSEGVPLHCFPAYTRAVELLVAGFAKLPLLEDDIYTKSLVERLNIKNPKFAGFVNEVVGREGAQERWAHIRKRIDTEDPWMATKLRKLVVEDVWPPIDTQVTARIGHLSKAPFSVHASTGRIAVALPDDCTEFDPKTCPSIATLSGLQKNAASVCARLAISDTTAW